ncbi:hypothetical protein [Streptomyces fractus]|uniref:phage baseplate protein n=1 Tax=Streptomyces fractus TaxID=641806 RepID=UPI003CE93F62
MRCDIYTDGTITVISQLGQIDVAGTPTATGTGGPYPWISLSGSFYKTSPEKEGPITTTGTPALLLDSVPTQSTSTVMQSFAIDSDAQELYVVQCIPDGVQLDGESAPVSYADRAKDGDLLLSRMNLATGDVLDYMYLRGFGHGTQFGVQRTSSGSVSLWLEGDSTAEYFTTNGYGTAISTTPYNAGATVDCSDTTTVTTYTDGTTPAFTFPAIDPTTNRLCVAANSGSTDEYVYSLYDLAQVEQGTWTPLKRITRNGGEKGFPQGMASIGEYLYMWVGHGDKDDAYITTLDWNTGDVVQQTQVPREPTDGEREPEGLSAQATASAVRLCCGFTIRDVERDSDGTPIYDPDGNMTGTGPRTYTIKHWE